MNQLTPLSAPLAAQHRRIADIELLRALAVAMVVAEHLPYNLVVWPARWVDYMMAYWRGWTGVDLFLAISGFVIGRLLQPMLRRPTDRLAYLNACLAFWTRRAWRLLPSAWLWLVIPLLLSACFNRGGFFGSTGANYQDLVAAVLQVANIHFAEGYGHAPHTTLFPYWSLSLEEQFYLALPVLIFLLRRRLPWLLLALVALQFRPAGDALAMMTRTGALAAGVLIACWAGTPSWRLCEPVALARHRWPRAAVLAAAILLLGALGSDVMTIVSIRTAMIMLVAAALVWIASYDRGYLLEGLLPRAPVLWLASRSYSIYLVHVPAMVAAREIWLRLSPPGTGAPWRLYVTAAALLLVAAEANHRLVEQPLRRRGAAIASRMAARVDKP